MAIKTALTDYVPSMTASASTDPITPALGDLHIPAASLPQYDQATEKADFRQVLYALLHEIYASWSAFAEADKPANMTVYKSKSGTAVENENEVSFTVRFTTSVVTENVKAE